MRTEPGVVHREGRQEQCCKGDEQAAAGGVNGDILEVS